jgi:c-di-GMP-binding flagellar brake protein YcgR
MTAVPSNHEKRRYSRVGFSTAIEILIQADGKETRLKGNSKDLSLKGIFVDAGTGFAPGTNCLVNVYLTGGIDKIELQMKGTVVRMSDHGMGLIFDSMDVDTYSHLKNIVYYNSSDGSV